MPDIRTIARRGFLIGSAAVAGGVAFGGYLALRPLHNPLQDDLEPGEATFNPWVRVTSDRITLVTPHVDLGQGAVHMQALLIAEEMDLELGQFETEYGPPAPAYYNTAMANEGAPFRVTDQGALAEMTRTALGIGGELIGLQGTGGSTSVSDSFEKLRYAGAVARETLKKAAAQVSGVAVSDLKTRAGAVILPDGTEMDYQSLAEIAAGLEPAEDVDLRAPETWRLIGKKTKRLDIVAKSTGTQNYGIDVKVDGMVYAALRLSPTRAPARHVDIEPAAQMDGVIDIVTISEGFAVIAQNTWVAQQAALAIEVDWADAVDYPADQEGHWAQLAEAFADDFLDKEWRADGDPLAASEAAPQDRIATEYRAPYVAHQPLEPLNATVLVAQDRVEVWASCQLPRFAQDKVAQASGRSSDEVIFHNQYAGGSFGHRLELDSVIFATEIARQIPGTPVKVMFSREEDFARDYPRHIGMARCRGSVRDGQLNCMSMDIASPSPIASQTSRIGSFAPGPDMQIPAGAWNAHYAIENFQVRAYRAEGLAPVSSWRSVGASSAGFYLEGFLDELIHLAGADPMEERLRLCSWDVARGVLEAVADRSNWGRDLEVGHGMGVAMVESFGVPVAEVVEVSTTQEGIKIDKVWAVADAGRVVDPVNFESQMQGGIIWGLGHAINSEITYRDGRAEQSNYHDAEGMRLYQTPQMDISWLENNPHIRGIGEPPVPPAAPALANAIFAATGVRLREMPFQRHVDFV